MNTAEAMAATLFIVGFKKEANEIMDLFGYGQEFLRINEAALALYSAAEDSDGVKAAAAQCVLHIFLGMAARRVLRCQASLRRPRHPPRRRTVPRRPPAAARPPHARTPHAARRTPAAAAAAGLNTVLRWPRHPL